MFVGIIGMGIKNRLYKYFFPEFIPLNSIRQMPSNSGVVLMYHEVLPDEVMLPAWTVVRESDFYWQMNYLQKHYDVISLNDALERIKDRSGSGKPFAVVSFDDGYKGNLNHVLPIMESLNLPFTVYVSTKAVVDKNPFWFDQIMSLLILSDDVHIELNNREKAEHFFIPGKAQEIVRWQAINKLLERLKKMSIEERDYWVARIAEHDQEGYRALKMLNINDLQKLASSDFVTIGSHTHGHELLDQLDIIYVIETLQTSKQYISNITGFTPVHFSYPNGNYNQIILSLVQDSGFATAMTTRSGFWTSKNPLMEIPRIGIGRFETRSQFKAKVSGCL